MAEQHEQRSTDRGQEALASALQTSFRVLRLVIVALLLIYLCSGIFIVPQHERAVVLVFGRTSGIGDAGIKEPGLHITFPRPVAEVLRVPARRIQTVETRAFWHSQPPGPMALDNTAVSPRIDPRRAGYTLTADANILHSIWSARYTVDDERAYLFGFTDIAAAISNELDHAVVCASTSFPVDRALRTDIEAYRAAVEKELRSRARRLRLGISVERVDVTALAPPRQVAAAFDAVVASEQEGSREVSEARAAASRTLNEADGTAARIRAQGTARKEQMLAAIAADADYFTKVYAKYKQNPRVTAETLWQDTVRRALSATRGNYIVRRMPSGEQELRILLTPEQKSPLAEIDAEAER